LGNSSIILLRRPCFIVPCKLIKEVMVNRKSEGLVHLIRLLLRVKANLSKACTGYVDPKLKKKKRE